MWYYPLSRRPNANMMLSNITIMMFCGFGSIAVNMVDKLLFLICWFFNQFQYFFILLFSESLEG